MMITVASLIQIQEDRGICAPDDCDIFAPDGDDRGIFAPDGDENDFFCSI